MCTHMYHMILLITYLSFTQGANPVTDVTKRPITVGTHFKNDVCDLIELLENQVSAAKSTLRIINALILYLVLVIASSPAPIFQCYVQKNVRSGTRLCWWHTFINSKSLVNFFNNIILPFHHMVYITYPDGSFHSLHYAEHKEEPQHVERRADP